MNKNNIVVFDFETGGLDPTYHEAIQVAGKAYNPRTLEPYPDGEFCMLMKPLHFDRLQEKALKVNGKTVDMLKSAPDQKVAWQEFVAWVGKWRVNKSLPIAAGKNIRTFDLRFVESLNKLHCPTSKLFHERTQIDLEDLLFYWFENETDPPLHNMDTVREFFGMSSDGAHDALVDVRQTGELIMRFLKMHRQIQQKKIVKFKGSMTGIC